MIIIYSNYGRLSSKVYNITKPIGHSIGGDIEYYIQRIKDIDGKVLEAGVGTGRMLIPILESGIDIVGLDYSKDILNICQNELDKRNLKSKLIHMDLLELKDKNEYEAIIMPTGSFCLITHRPTAITILENLYTALENGGRLILDLIFPNGFIEGVTSTSIFKTEDGGITMENKSLEIDWINQISKSLLVYEEWKDGNLLDTELQNYTVCWYGIREFEYILSHIGYKNIVFSANYEFNNRDLNNGDIITVEARK